MGGVLVDILVLGQLRGCAVDCSCVGMGVMWSVAVSARLYKLLGYRRKAGQSRGIYISWT